MKLDELDQRMRVYETAQDYCVPPGIFPVARLDGRSFTRLTKEVHPFDAPFDIRFRDMMTATLSHLMTCGFNVIYGYCQSDEISLLFNPNESAFQRKMRKFNSVLAGEASAKFSLLLGDVAVFDCRMSLLPNQGLVLDYFRWRQEDAHRNALNAHCYWRLRHEGLSQAAATAHLAGMNTAKKNQLLFERGINFNDLPLWQKRGVGVYWETFTREAHNPKTGQAVLANRRRLKTDDQLPMREAYNAFLQQGFLMPASSD